MAATTDTPPRAAVAGDPSSGRRTVDVPFTAFGGSVLYIAPPPSADQDWRLESLDTSTLSRIEPARLLQLLADLSPELSDALWSFLRLCNPGFTIVVRKPGSEDIDKVGTAIVEVFLSKLRDYYVDVNVVIGKLFLAAFLRGAFFAELVLDDTGRAAVDLATPDPASARFRLIQDPVRGQVWQLGQHQATVASGAPNRGGFVPLDFPTVRYVPIDPFPGPPYGRPIAGPAVFTALFLVGLLHDLRRVIAQQGYPRHDISVKLAALMEAMPAEVRDDPEKFKEWSDSVITEVQSFYAQLQPDDAFVHIDSIEVNRASGAVDSSVLGGVDALLQALERMAARALKTVPLLMGITDGASEANANRQWEVHVAGIKSIQHYCESLLSYLLVLVCNVAGVQAEVEVTFAELRAAEEMRDEQTRALADGNAAYEYAMGWASQDEVANERVGHDADVPEPRVWPKAFTGTGDTGAGLVNTNPEPGSARMPRLLRRLADLMERADAVVPLGAANPLPPLPGAEDFTAADERAILALWDQSFPEYEGLLDAKVVG